MGRDVEHQNDRVAGRNLGAKDDVNDLVETNQSAECRNCAKQQALCNKNGLQAFDASVGLGGGEGDAKIGQARSNLGQASVAGIWSFQGSRPYVANGNLLSPMGGDALGYVDAKTEKTAWKTTIRKDKELLDSVLTPPALVNDKVFVSTALGEAQCLSTKTGAVLWTVSVGEPPVFLPTVVQGRI